MKTNEILSLPYRRHRNNSAAVHFRLTQLCGGGRKTIADGPTTLGEAIGILEAGMHDIDHDRLETIRMERTGVPYDEDGNIAPEHEETVGDLVEVHNLGDWSATLEEVPATEERNEELKRLAIEKAGLNPEWAKDHFEIIS